MSQIISEKRIWYQKMDSIYCPILNAKVYLTSEGFNHLIYESNRQPRKQNEQYMKLMCLSYAPKVIQNCTNVTQTRKVRVKKKGKWKAVTQYELVYEVKLNKKIRVILQKIGDGRYTFISVMPHDKASKHPSKQKTPRKGRS